MFIIHSLCEIYFCKEGLLLSNQKKTVWIIGNITLGFIGFFAYLWGVFTAWANGGNILLYGIGSIIIVLLAFIIFNYLIITNKKAKHWGLSLAVFLGSAIVTILVHGLLQNTIFE